MKISPISLNMHRYQLKSANIAPVSSVSFGKEAVYRIDKDMNCERFESLVDMSKKTGMSLPLINAGLAGRVNMVDNYVIAYARDLEQIGTNGAPYFDMQKVARLLQKKAYPKAVYAIDVNGKYKKYLDREELAKGLGRKEVSLAGVYDGEIKTIAGHTIVKASKVETIMQDGSIIVEPKKIQQILSSNPIETALYAVDETGKQMKFPNSSVLAETIGCSRVSVYNVLSGRTKKVKGCYLFSADDVEIKKKDGTRQYDKKKALKLIAKLNEPEIIAYKFDENGRYVKCTPEEIAQMSGLKGND